MKRGAGMLDASIVIFAAASMLQFAAAGTLSGQEPGGDRDTSAPVVSGVLEGTLTIVWGDPHPKLGSGGTTLYTLTLLDGSSVALRLEGKEALASQYFGQRVVVSGQAISDSFAPSRIVVDSISLSLSERAQALAAVIGTKKVIYLLLKFADDSSVPHAPAFYSNLNNPDTPPPGEVFPSTINGFFKKTSWNQFSWIGDVGGIGGVPATGWLTLPFPKSHYANCGWASTCADIAAIANDGMALGTAAGINFTGYNNVNFVLSNDLDCCSYGGGFFYQGQLYGATWEPSWGQETGSYVHEMGHSIGLPHSGWVYSSYDSPWDMMSAREAATSVACGSYDSANSAGQFLNVYCTEPGDGYITPHKDYLGWIPVANEVVIDTPSPGATVTLEAGALPLGSAAKMIKICSAWWPCTGSTARYLTVEARVKGLGGSSQFDNGIPGEGVIIHSFQGDRPTIGAGDPCFSNNQSGWALPVDATPGDWNGAPTCNRGSRTFPNYALYNAQWLPGQTYVDPASGRSIQVQSRAGSSFVIVVGPVPSPTVTGVSPASGSVLGGTVVTVSGTEFQPGVTVSFGGAAAAGVTYVSATTIFAIAPIHAAGVVTVTVTNADSQSSSMASAYTYTAATTLLTVTITTPSSTTYSTSTTPIALAGTASGNAGVALVTCLNLATGITVTASGTTSWSCGVGLVSGANAITVIAGDVAGNTGNDTIAVTYGPTSCYSLTTGVSPYGSGTVSINTGQSCSGGFTAGSNISLTATPQPGWMFSGWSGFGGIFSSAWSNPTTFAISSNASVTALYTAITPSCYSLTASVSPANGGTVSVSTGQNCSGGFTAGTNISFTATPQSGWAFVGWSGSGGNFSTTVGSSTSFTITGNASVTALFASSASCTEDSLTMCLIGGRYRVTSYWRNQYAGGALSNLNKTRLTDATGAFWIADANTYEYMIRFNTVTDNGRAWISIPMFTDVEFWIMVQDTVNGQSQTYHSPAGNRTLIYDPFFFVYP